LQALILFLVIAAWANVRAIKARPALRAYLFFAGLSALVILIFWRFIGLHFAYRYAYAVVRPPELIATLVIAVPRVQALLFASAIVMLAFLGGEAVHGAPRWIALLQGGVYALAGVSLAVREMDNIEATLAVTWLMLALFLLGLVINWNDAGWQQMNLWWSSALMTAAFFVVGLQVNPFRQR